MIRLALILMAAFLAGCAAPARDKVTAGLAPIPLRSWQALQVELQDAPEPLRRAITQAGEARLAPEPEPSGGPAALRESRESRESLVDILTHTDRPELQPDAEFGFLYQVLIGEDRPEQSYASALAAYLTQRDFACSQPLYAGYFQRRYATGQPVGRCRSEVPFSVAIRHHGSQIVWVDPARVSSIHLLFASKSDSMASLFGHVALRLVVCPQGKATAGQCDSNLNEHLVLGYRAHIDELSLKTMKALTGDYRAYLFANQFMDVYEDYAIGEFRDFYSVPLPLDAAQRELMVRELADIHWRFSDRYQFFTRNCATMLQQALRVTWSAFSASAKMADVFLRPDSLFAALRDSPLVEGAVLASLEVAEREGFYFSNTRQFYDRALQEVREARKKPEFSNLESYLAMDPVSRRAYRREDAVFLARLGSDKHLREAQIMLEEYALLRSERVLMTEAGKYFEQQNFLARSDSIGAQLDAEHARVFDDCLITPLRHLYSPPRSTDGIPQKFELPAGPGPGSLCESAQSKRLMQEAIAGIKDAKSGQWQRLSDISVYWKESFVNLNLLKEM